ncbi:hypothetical protein AMATHDRAFT_144697, partial [Amanita thiersii Skay4041]
FQRPARGGDGVWLHDKAPAGPAASINNKIVVSNLHYEITPKDLVAIFGQIGTLVREPLIRYDRSGRSSGVAIISFETTAEATRAKKQFDGILAKGQPMSIAYDTVPPRARRSASAPNQSLLNRIQKPALLERLSRDDAAKASAAPRGAVGRGRSKPQSVRAKRETKQPKTAEELDKELDAFMGDVEPGSQLGLTAAQVTTTQEDVEMS